MPLVGFVDALGNNVPFSEYLELARSSPGRTYFPYEFLAAMADDQEERKEAGFSATMLTGCQRKAYWTTREDYYDRPEHRWPAARGTAIHEYLEKHPVPGVYYETRYARDLTLDDGSVFTITGKADRVDPTNKVIVDYKTIGKDFPDKPDDQFVRQLNVYRWLVQDGYVLVPGKDSGIVPGSLVFWEIDWLGLIYITDKDIRKYTVPLLPLAEVEGWIRERVVRQVEAARGGRIPERVVKDPTKNTLCNSWCPFYRMCLDRGE